MNATKERSSREVVTLPDIVQELETGEIKQRAATLEQQLHDERKRKEALGIVRRGLDYFDLNRQSIYWMKRDLKTYYAEIGRRVCIDAGVTDRTVN